MSPSLLALLQVSKEFMQVFDMVCKGGPTGVGAVIAAMLTWAAVKGVPKWCAKMDAQRRAAERVVDGFPSMKSSLEVLASNSTDSKALLQSISTGVARLEGLAGLPPRRRPSSPDQEA